MHQGSFTTTIRKRDIVNRTGGVETPDGRVLFGLDAEVYLKMKAKEDPSWEKRIGEWIVKVVGEPLEDPNDLFVSLKSGIVLCKLINIIKPGAVKKFNSKAMRGKLHPLMERENISLFLESCWGLGLPAAEIFVVADLHARQGMAGVLNNLASLSAIAPNFGVKVDPVVKAHPSSGGDQGKKIWEIEAQVSQIVGGISGENEDIEELEEELRSVTLKLEECQRTMIQMEASKKNLSQMLILEKKKLGQMQREVDMLRGQGKGCEDPRFVMDLKIQRDKLIIELQTIKDQMEFDAEKIALRKELKKLKEKLPEEKPEEDKPTEESNQELLNAAEYKRLQEKIESLIKENLETSEKYALEKKALEERLESLKKDESELNKSNDEIQSLRKKVKDQEDNIKTLNEQNTVKISKLVLDLERLKSISSLEIKQLIAELDLAEKQKIDESVMYNEIKVDLENELRISKAEHNLEVAKIQSEIKAAKMEHDILLEELGTMKEKYEQQIEELKAHSKTKLEKIKEKFALVEAEKVALEEQFLTKRNELDAQLNLVISEGQEKVEKCELDLQKLRKEKNELQENQLLALQKLEAESLQKETQLKKELEELKSKSSEIISKDVVTAVEPSIESSKLKAELEQIQKEKEMLAEQHQKEKDQLLQKHIESYDAIERRLLDEKTKREKFEAEIKTHKAKLDSELHRETTKKAEEAKKWDDALQNLEKDRKVQDENHSNRVKELNEELQKLKNETALNLNKLESKKIEAETERNSTTEEREKTIESLNNQLKTTKDIATKDVERLEERIKKITEENQALSEIEIQLENETSPVDLIAKQQHLLQDWEEIRKNFQKQLSELNQQGSTLLDQKRIIQSEKQDLRSRIKDVEGKWSNERSELQDKLDKAMIERSKLEKSLAQQAPEKKIKQLERQIRATVHDSQIEIQKLQNILRGEEFLKEIEDFKSIITIQAKTIEKLEEEKASLTTAKRDHRRTRRVTMRLDNAAEKPDEQDIKDLRVKMEKVMSGEHVLFSDLIKFKRLFRLDTGRRIFAFMLKEYTAPEAKPAQSQTADEEEKGPLILSQSSFDMLKVLIDLVLNSIDLTNAADFISGKILLENSSMIGRIVKGSNQPQFIQEAIKPHPCWQNTFFWQEYFWSSSTAKFNELFGSGSKEGEWNDQEKQFFASEIVDFGKIMFGWGNLPFSKMIVFVESLADLCTLSPESKDKVVKALDHFNAKETKNIRSGHRKSRLFVSPEQAKVTLQESKLRRQTLALGRGVAPARPTVPKPSLPRTSRMPKPPTPDPKQVHTRTGSSGNTPTSPKPAAAPPRGLAPITDNENVIKEEEIVNDEISPAAKAAAQNTKWSGSRSSRWKRAEGATEEPKPATTSLQSSNPKKLERSLTNPENQLTNTPSEQSSPPDSKAQQMPAFKQSARRIQTRSIAMTNDLNDFIGDILGERRNTFAGSKKQ